MQKHLTRDTMHTGLSNNKDDAKWSDVLNFRFNNNTTTVVPFKKVILRTYIGMHSLVNGIGNLFYVIGDKMSYYMRGEDNSECGVLWRGSVKNLPNLQDRTLGESKLIVRGSYTGTQGGCYRVTYNGGVLTTYKPPVIEPTEEESAIECVDCGLTVNRIRIQVLDTNGEPIPQADITLYVGRLISQRGMANATGKYDYTNRAETMSADVSVGGYRTKKVTFDVIDTVELQTITVVLTRSIAGWTYYAGYDEASPDTHECDQAVYKMLINGYMLGVANLNNANDGGFRHTQLTITPEDELNMLGLDHTVEEVTFALECYPESPYYDHGGPYGETCHTNIAHIVIKDPGGNIVYDGFPTGNFTTITL